MGNLLGGYWVWRIEVSTTQADVYSSVCVLRLGIGGAEVCSKSTLPEFQSESVRIPESR